jgi:NTE family protein
VKEIGVALSGGGTRGVAHIGVLRVLEREEFQVRAMTGTSMGGFIGAFYANGMPLEEIERLVIRAYDEGIVRGRPDGPGIFGLSQVEDLLRRNLGSREFCDLQIPFAVTATDLESGVELVIREGSLVEGVLATIALPGIFSPKWLAGRRLVDGGIVDPVPVQPLRQLFNGVCLAVVLAAAPKDWDKPQTSDLLDDLPMMGILGRLRPAQALGIFIRAMEIAGRNFTELRLQIDSPDVIIRPDVSHVGLLADDVDLQGLIEIGASAAEGMLPAMHGQFSARKRLLRGVRDLVRGAG